MSNVRSYTDKELLDKVKSLDSFKGIPEGYWILGVQSQEDQFNGFDDKFYLFKGEKFNLVTTGTTNAGKSGLKGYDNYGLPGCAVIKTNEWYYDLWAYGLHKGKMPALRQVNPIKFYRDDDKDEFAEEIGKMYEDIIYSNFHFCDYNLDIKYDKSEINGWSIACQVPNEADKYKSIISKTKKQRRVSYCLLKEF